VCVSCWMTLRSETDLLIFRMMFSRWHSRYDPIPTVKAERFCSVRHTVCVCVSWVTVRSITLWWPHCLLSTIISSQHHGYCCSLSTRCYSSCSICALDINKSSHHVIRRTSFTGWTRKQMKREKRAESRLCYLIKITLVWSKMNGYCNLIVDFRHSTNYK